MGRYILRVVCAALISGMVQSLAGGKGPVKLLCSLFLTITVLSPVSQIPWEGQFSLDFGGAGEALVSQGKALAQEAWLRDIKARTEAYIQDKAADMGQQIQAEVHFQAGDCPVPVAAQISGRVSPYGKRSLEGILQEALGIQKENIKWIG